MIRVRKTVHVAIVVAPIAVCIATAWYCWATHVANDNPRALVEDFINIVRDRALRADRVDWRATRDRVLGELHENPTPHDVYRAYRQVLYALNDPHTSHIPRDVYQRLMMPSSSPASDDFVAVTRESETVIRIAVTGYESTNTQRSVADGLAALDRVERELAHAKCGVVVDLSQNMGGNMYPMLMALAPLLGNDTFMYFIGRDGRQQAMKWDDGDVDHRKALSEDYPRVAARLMQSARWNENAQRPIAVLTSGLTASSGEATLIAMSGRPWVHAIGNATRGLSTANAIVRLRDGSALALTVARIADRSGRTFDGPIAPDIALPVFLPDDKTAIAAAVRDVATRCADSPPL